MKNKKNTALIIWLILLCPFSVLAQQNVDSIIRDIRSEFRTIVDNKEKYKQVVVDVPPQKLFPYDDDREGDPPDLKKKITYYLENDEIKLVSVFNIWFHWIYREEIIEYYLKNDQVFFIYQQLKDIYYNDTNWDEYTTWDGSPTEVTEERFYYNSDNECVRYLIKKSKGRLSEVENLLQNTVNIEEDCPEVNVHSKIHLFYEENIDVLFERYRKHVDITTSIQD